MASEPKTVEEILNRVKTSIVEAVTEAGARGVPGGYLYAVLSSRGITLHTYTLLMAEIVDEGKLRREGEVYYAVPSAGDHP